MHSPIFMEEKELDYKRYDGESDEELIYRITGEKEQIGSWQDVADILNELLGTEYTESKFRKQRQAFDKMLAANQSKFVSGNEQLQELVLQRQELEKEKVKLRDERNELLRVIREEARKESYKDQMLRSIEEHQGKPLAYDENKQFTGVLKTDNDLIVSCTDIHAGIYINNFFNKFDIDVLRDRFNQYLDKIFEVQVRHGSENVHVILSELVSGIIHNSLRIENNQNLIEQFLTVTDYIAQFLSELSYHFNEVNVYICPGNHSRISPKKEESLKGENIDHLALPYLKAKLQNFRNIVFNINDIEESIAVFKVRDNLIMSSHGDKDSPANVVQKFTLLFGIKPSIVYLGHRHTNGLTTVYDTKVIESGCLSGTDNYALDLRVRNKPEQTISVITENGLDCLYDVKFD
mgnify:CR=1 FL=1